MSKNTKSLKLGFVVNPIAGMGGRVGLKGTDGVYKKALELGAKPVSPQRAVEFLKSLDSLYQQEENVNIEIISVPKMMGEYELTKANISINSKIIPLNIGDETTAEDTKNAVKTFVNDNNVDLVIFVGGDGTARDVMDALKEINASTPILGVPSGVKMYSAVFAYSPEEAAEVVLAFIKGQARVMDLEVMDIDEEAFRNNRLEIKLYGYAKALYVPMMIQHSKEPTPETVDETENQRAIARYVVEIMDPEGYYILCPGTTVKMVADELGVEKTLLGVDIYHKGKVYKDVNERQILEIIKDFSKAWIIVSPIGKQGVIFGRGNQQISPEVIRRVGKEKIIVIATQRKIRELPDGSLKVDTGDKEVDNYLKGYIKVLIDYRTWRMIKVV
ncbi:MAG: ATP-NAD kinase family protein [Candidatus Asgardarchaeia archaeon]|nr:ATP-NAD kinase family protein [Candidatus Odinarchaeota archaeon]